MPLAKAPQNITNFE